MANDILNQVVSYGLQNGKKKDEILSALLKTGQVDVSTAVKSLKDLGDMGAFDSAEVKNDPLAIDRSGLTSVQNQAYNFGTRTLESGKTITDLEKGIAEKGFLGSIGQMIDEKQVGTALGQRFVPPEFQKFDQAKRDFINAVLRRESGAVISPDEFDNATKQYFPVPGEDPATTEQKRRNRELVTKNLLEESGVKTEGLSFSASQGNAADGQMAPGFQEAMAFAKQNPNHPDSIQINEAIKNGLIDPNTGLKKIATPAAATQPEEKGFLDRVGEKWGNRVDEMNRIVGRDQGLASAGLQAFGQGVGSLMDVVGEGMSSVTSAVTPDFIEKPVKKGFEDVITTLMDTDTAKNTISAYQEFSKLHPEAAGNLEAAGELLNAVLTAAGGMKTAQIGGKVLSAAKETAGQLAKKTATTVAGAAEKRAAKKSMEEALEVTTKNLNKKQAINVLEESGKAGKGAQETGILGKVEAVTTAKDKAVAESVAGLVGKKASAAKNVANINQEIVRISEDEVKPFLQKNNAIFNKKTLNARLKAVEVPDFVKTDKTLENTYNLIRQRMIQVIDKGPKNMDGLWDSRKEFDRIMKEQFGDVMFNPEKNSAVKKAYLDMRTEVNNFIAEHTPNGDELFKGKLSRLSNMYDARHRIAESGYKELGGNRFSRWAKRNPKTANAAKYGAGAVVGAKVYQGLSD